MVPEVDKAYAAGVIDSDGSLGAYLSGKNDIMKLVVTVSVLDPRVPAWFMERWGGGVGEQVNTLEKGRVLWRWQLVGIKSATFVRDVLPYLVAKREQADIYIRLASTMTSNGCRVTQETKALRREWVEELSRLKWV